jgi:nicotinamidase-related amidase
MSPAADEAMPRPPAHVLPVFAELVPEIGPARSDVVIAKRGADAFFSTELDLQLRRRGLDTLVLCGIATDYCVESTARTALEIGYRQVFAEDGMTSMSTAQHEGALGRFRLMGRVRKTTEILMALEG